MACTLKRYRQEWKYGFRLVHGLCDCDDVVLVAEETQYDPATVSLRRDWPTEQEVSGFLARRSESDRWLIQKLFWDNCTEAEIAQSLGLSQQAVSKRKRKLLRTLRCCLENSEINEGDGCKLDPRCI